MDTTKSLEEAYDMPLEPITATEYINKLSPEVDEVNSPSHYTAGGIECIEYIKDTLTPEEYRGYLRGCMIKYQHRLMLKGDAKKNAGKMAWYNDKLVQEL